MLFTTTAYNSQGEALETETQTDSWEATEICLTLSEQFGHAQLVWYALNGKRVVEGEYTDRD